MAVADMEYRAEIKAKKKAYVALKKIARQQGKRPPPNPYPNVVKEIQAEEKKYVYDRFYNPRIRQILRKLQEEKAVEDQDRMRGGWGGGGGGVGGGGWGSSGGGGGGGGGGGMGGGGGWGSSGSAGAGMGGSGWRSSGGGSGSGGWGGR
ncbi:hypothetical protein RchiOBHm_Chr7g0220341 [Rosa chinensis]|uniref:Uncharacterized protein n=1 Tax=Rosa chinensis TaxID=74649 RepID=A0A2P6PCR7_ROSCH|nr:hypothetical protein RchiOBHm_Chr7g0220341 [Rosa chinensis]